MSVLQARAMQMLYELNDEHIQAVIDFIKKLSPPKNLNVPDNDIAQRMAAFNRLQNTKLDLPADFDLERERMEHLREKYGDFD